MKGMFTRNLFASLLVVVSPILFGQQANAAITDVLIDTNTTWSGELLEYLKTKNPKVRMQITEFAPGESNAWHTHDVPLYIYVMSGEFQVDLYDGRQMHFNPGEAFIEVANEIHFGANPGLEPCQLLIVFPGEEGMPFMNVCDFTTDMSCGLKNGKGRNRNR